MAAQDHTDAVKQIHYLAAALKAPRITEAAQRLADQARDAGWTHEDYLAAVLEREVSPATPPARSCASAPPGSRPARPSRTSTGTPNPPSANRSPRWPPAAFLTEARNIVLLGPPGTGKTHLATALGDHRRPPRPPGAVRDRDRLGHPPHRRPPPRPATRTSSPGCAATG